MRRVFAGPLFAFATAALADPALACSCARNPTAERILASATAVFTGTVRQSVPAAPGRSVTTFTVTESLCSTWMFVPHVPISGGLILQMRALVAKQGAGHEIDSPPYDDAREELLLRKQGLLPGSQ